MADWWLTKDGDLDCLALYERHYSIRSWRDGRRRNTGFAGPGERVILRTRGGNACFVWKPVFHDISRRDSGQRGVCCSFFRNESAYRSSDLIAQADAIADHLWPHCRHYTYVNPARIRSVNPGYCFLVAGWRRCGRTKGGLIVLDRPQAQPASQDETR